jgi:hypothetical protein
MPSRPQGKRRIKGHIQRLGLPYDLPCYFGGKPIDLLVKADLDFLIASIKGIERDAGAALGFLVVDTQSRTMGGDENSTRDGAPTRRRLRPSVRRQMQHSGSSPIAAQ